MHVKFLQNASPQTIIPFSNEILVQEKIENAWNVANIFINFKIWLDLNFTYFGIIFENTKQEESN